MGLFDNLAGGLNGVARGIGNAFSPMPPVNFSNLPIPQKSNTGAMPKPPSYISARDGDKLKSDYLVTPGQLGDASAWQRLMTDQNTAMTQNLLNDTNQKGLSATQDSMNELMMNGGMSSGARERMAGMGARNALFASQDAMNQGNLNKLGIDLQAENMNRDASKFNIGNDMNAQMSNTGRALADLGDLNASNRFTYGEQMKDYTGRYTADAMKGAYGASQGGGGLLGRISDFLGL